MVSFTFFLLLISIIVLGVLSKIKSPEPSSFCVTVCTSIIGLVCFEGLVVSVLKTNLGGVISFAVIFVLMGILCIESAIRY